MKAPSDGYGLSVETSFDDMCLVILRDVRHLLVKCELQFSERVKILMDKQLNRIEMSVVINQLRFIFTVYETRAILEEQGGSIAVGQSRLLKRHTSTAIEICLRKFKLAKAWGASCASEKYLIVNVHSPAFSPHVRSQARMSQRIPKRKFSAPLPPA